MEKVNEGYKMELDISLGTNSRLKNKHEWVFISKTSAALKIPKYH